MVEVATGACTLDFSIYRWWRLWGRYANDKGDDESAQGVLLLGGPHLRPCFCLHCHQQELFRYLNLQKMQACLGAELRIAITIAGMESWNAKRVFNINFTNNNNRDGSLECHAFLCPKRKVAQAATLTIAQVLFWSSSSSSTTRKSWKSSSRSKSPPFLWKNLASGL